ncbi:MAG: exosortase-associated EpsI family protein [Phycisphaerae bacterium]
MTTTVSAPPPRADVNASRESLAGVSRRTFVRALCVAGLIAAGTVAMHTLEASLHLTFDKPPMPLRKPLSQMKKQLGEGPRYVANRPDDALEEDILQVLGTRDYLLREYTDTTKKSDQPGATLDLNVNYYPTGSATPHVPEICWAGSGLEEAKDLRKTFIVPGVKRADGRVQDIGMHLISFEVGSTGFLDNTGAKKYRNVAYLFEVNGDCVVTPKEVISEFWKASNKHAYHSKIEVTIQEPCTQEEAEKAIGDFIKVALPAVEECLPAKDSKKDSN